MDLSDYRASPSEQARIASLFSLMPNTIKTGLDIGARDGYISIRMAERSERVTALDLTMPNISHEKIICVKGDATKLEFASNSFDIVVCAEVLEHISSPSLELACQEIARVSNRWVVIGVPLNQDIRFGATRCPSCGKTNPPWGHVNSFSVASLETLFPSLLTRQVEFVGTSTNCTNIFSHTLLEYAGHPYGTYSQEEVCVYCNAEIKYLDNRSFFQKLATRIAHSLSTTQQRLMPAHPMWVNMLFEKK